MLCREYPPNSAGANLERAADLEHAIAFGVHRKNLLVDRCILDDGPAELLALSTCPREARIDAFNND